MLARFKIWYNRQQPISERKTYWIRGGTYFTFWFLVGVWISSIPNGDYMLSRKFVKDLRQELVYAKQIWFK
jgi:hypothetical protein